jgi:hypothetical protein
LKSVCYQTLPHSSYSPVAILKYSR